ncbi:MAG: hypothetical protein RLZZ385_349 [Pseudomonadota bacterium]|jgi:SAM-dependent methyltransferase
MADRDTWNARYLAKPLVWSAAPNALLAQATRQLTPGKALDVACGEGRNAIHLAEHGWQVTAVDFSDVAIGKARQIAAQRGLTIDWRVEDINTLTVSPASFDLVAVVFLHTGSAQRAQWLPKLVNGVAPGGLFIYIGHDPRNIVEGVGGPQDPDVLPSLESLRESLSDFHIERAEVFRRTVTNETGHGEKSGQDYQDATALDTFIIARRKPQ